MNHTKHKPNLAAQMAEHEMPEWKGKWRNYWLCVGRNCLGSGIYDSKEEAAKAADINKIEARARKIKANAKYCKFPDGVVIPYDNLLNATVIQIPVQS